MKKPWYRIKASADNSPAELLIFGDIGESWWDEESITAKSVAKDLAALKGRPLTVRINSYGGSVADGIAIYNALRRHAQGATVTTSNDGVAMSAASLIFMAGDEREMAENALFMVHAPWSVTIGNAVDLRESADVLDKYSAAMSSSYARSALSEDEIIGLLTDGQDHFYTAAEAELAGFATRITDELPVAAAYRNNRYTMPHPGATHESPKEPAMPQPKKPESQPSNQNPDPNNSADVASIEAAAEARALAKLEERNKGIRGLFMPFMATHPALSGLQDECLDNTKLSLEAVRSKLLTKLGEGAEPLGGNPHIEAGADAADKLRAAATEAMLVRSGLERDAKVRAQFGQNPFRGARLTDLARASLQRVGVRTDGMSQMEIVGAAFTQSTSDFPILLENTMHKALQMAYATAALTWRRFCGTGSVSDFRAHHRYRVGSLSNLESKTELGEFKHKAIPDGEKSSVSVATKGNIINLSREAIINDDLGAFVGLSASLGRAAARTIEADVYSLLAENSGLGPTMSDGHALFDNAHGNITTSAALSMAAIDADRVAMAEQKDVGGNDYLDLRPQILLVPTALGGTARTINEAVYDPDTANKLQKPNMVNGLFSDIVDTPRLSGTRRYLFADPTQAPVLEVDFLDGNQEPYLEVQNGFTVDGAAWKVRLDFGVAAIDYRGAVTNAGA